MGAEEKLWSTPSEARANVMMAEAPTARADAGATREEEKAFFGAMTKVKSVSKTSSIEMTNPSLSREKKLHPII